MSQPLDKEFARRIERIETLIQQIERSADPNARTVAQELVQALMDLHGAGLTQLLDLVAQSAESGPALIETIARDDLVGSLLLLYGLHPLDLETRVQNALEQVRPYLRSHGGNVELVGVGADGAVRLRMQGSCHGCPSSAQTLKDAIEAAILGAAPDVSSLAVEGVVAPADAPPAGFVSLEQLLR